jgi:signal-transduction protein with cAMP-binding, CBS, and nucleotidyltransferase domain
MISGIDARKILQHFTQHGTFITKKLPQTFCLQQLDSFMEQMFSYLTWLLSK